MRSHPEPPSINNQLTKLHKYDDMPHPTIRSACDRCHDQKLRCTRSASGGACSRCTRAKAACTWMPSSSSSSTTRRPRAMDTTTPPAIDILLPSTSAAESLNFGIAATWSDPAAFLPPDASASATTLPTPSFTSLTPYTESPSSPARSNHHNDWQSRFNHEWVMLSAEQAGNNGTSTSSNGHGSARSTTAVSVPRDKSRPDNLPLDTIRHLTELHLDLYSLASRVPKPPTCILQPLSWKDKDVALDRTFQLSYDFISAVDRLSAADSHQSEDASLLLVLSCYQRLIEIYGAILGNMQACLDRSAITAPEDYVRMPDVKVGSFSLPDSSALQITLILQLARHLLRRIGSMIVRLNQKSLGTMTSTDPLTSATLQTVSSRENELIERITKLRNTLVTLDIL
ncbi:hypothetical protein F4678DRAFT_38658 [Xylaria arbuscula]|nr:hypothetical protein F4678DRAFT_38658 [Xylaria arbuscula]